MSGGGGSGDMIGMALAATPIVGPIYGGFVQGQAHEQEKEALKQRAEQEKFAAKERAAKIKQELMYTLGAQRASMAARGINPDMGSGFEMLNLSRYRADADLAANTLNHGWDINTNKTQQKQAGIAKKASIMNGFSQATSQATSMYLAGS